jgi:hypothetical protein
VRVDEKPTLVEAGIHKALAHEGRKLGRLSEIEFERAVKTARTAVDRIVKIALGNTDKKQHRVDREVELASRIRRCRTSATA